MNILIDLFDHSGHAAEPYRKNGWHVIQVDIKHGIDILEWDYKTIIHRAVNDNWKYSAMPKIGILAAIPCTDYANCGATWFAKKDADGSTAKSQLLVDKTYEIIQHIKEYYSLSFWRVENPMSRIHKLNTWLGPVKFKFNACDFSGYLDTTETERAQLYSLREFKLSELDKSDVKAIMDANLYNKETWLWGKFNDPVKRFNEAVYKEYPGHILYGGKSERTKELRSVDPKGFCQAFYEANN
jgi:hypothetical protein